MADKRDFAQCSCEENQYEFDVIETMIDWLESVTGILWVHSYTDGGRPTEIDKAYKGDQWGTVHIDSYEYKQRSKKPVSSVIENTDDVCTVAERRIAYTITWKVYNFANLPKNTCRDIRTSGDVLMRAMDAYQDIERLRCCLTDRNITLTGWEQISNFQTMAGTLYERGSQITTYFDVQRKSSYVQDKINGVEIVA